MRRHARTAPASAALGLAVAALCAASAATAQTVDDSPEGRSVLVRS